MKTAIFFMVLILTVLFTGMHAQESDSDMIIEIATHDNGLKKTERSYRLQEPHGIWKTWNEAGQILSEESYADGVRVGTWRNWYDNGSKKEEMTYLQDQLHGRYTRWFENGAKEFVGEYDQGMETGDWTLWDEDGHMTEKRTYYRDSLFLKRKFVYEYNGDQVQAIGYEWHDNERMKLELRELNGKLEGEQREWFVDGTTALETTYVAGKEEGLHTEYYESGVLRLRSQMLQGLRHGRTEAYNEEGKIIWAKEYRDGVFLYDYPLDETS